MEKIIILTYSFPPCNLTASQRAFGWAKNMKASGLYPIIITRNWDRTIETPIDVYKQTTDKIKHIKTDKYEVFYIPHKGNLRTKIYSKYGDKKFSFIRKTLTFLELIIQNFSNRIIPHRDLYHFTDKYLLENKDINKMVITANPFNLFKFGYLLHKKHNIKWIADYRDDWSTDELNQKKNILGKTVHYFDKKSELKWIKSASLITSVSEYYVNKISKFVDKPGKIIYNGFDEEEVKKYIANESFDEYTITYNGTLYPSQPIEIFLEGIIKLINYYKNTVKIKIYFPGLAYNQQQKERVEKYIGNYKNYFAITNRLPKDEVMKIQAKSDLLLMISHNNIKGVPSSKLFEYIGLQKKIMLVPSDNDVIENILTKTNMGIICNSEMEVFEILKSEIENKFNNQISVKNFNANEMYFFSKKTQCEIFADAIKKL